jgi:hypothetical protein
MENPTLPSDIVRMICPNLRCRAVLSVPTSARGKTVRCRQCGTRVKVPIPAEIPRVEAGGAAPAGPDA